MDERCFALRRQCRCAILDVTGCPGCNRCKFYKPVWMYLRDLDRARVHISCLPKAKQEAIAEKYHHGNMPWKGTH